MTGMTDDPGRGISLVQPGWQVYSKDGELLGQVLAVDGQLIHLRPEGRDDRSLEIGTDAIIEQDESEMRVWIDFTAADVAAR